MQVWKIPPVALLAIMCTPAVAAIIPSDAAFVRSLDGVWRFKLEAPVNDAETPVGQWREKRPIKTPETFECFFALDYKEDKSWSDLAVPGNWEMAGFSPATYNEPDNTSGFYRKWFDVPAEWEGRKVLVNFDGVQNGAEIWLNGKPVDVSEPSWGRPNYHESGWTAWQADLTPAVRFGQRNLIALRVTKNTRSSNCDTGDYFFLGGIHRPVTLFAVPKTHVSDLTVQTHLLEGGRAEVKVSVTVSGGPAKVCARLSGVGQVERSAGADQTAELVIPVPQPQLWSAEHPYLYTLDVELKDSAGTAIERVTRRIGIREVTIKNGVLLLNGVPIKMTGICRHDVYPTKGTAIDEEVWRKDLTLMKQNNINAVRTSHYPYGARFYDICDEMGFYVIDELPYCWSDNDDQSLEPAFLQRARETVRRDKNHPCIIIWGIGNEGGGGKNFTPTAALVGELDPTRPRLVSCRDADKYRVEFDDRHYTSPPNMTKLATDESRRAKWPIIFTENPNVWDVRLGADYGCLDLWYEVIKRTWDVAWKYDCVPGSFAWEWQDRAVCDQYPRKIYHVDETTGLQYLKVKGLVDAWRRPRPDLYNLKMVYSPIKVEEEVDLASEPGFAILDVTNRYSFTDLALINADWQLLRADTAVKKGTAHFTLAPRTTGKVEFRLPEGVSADALRIDFNHPGGWNVVSYRFDLVRPKPFSPPTMSTTPPAALRFPRLNLVSNSTRNDATWWRTIERFRGALVNVKSSFGDIHTTPLPAAGTVDADIALVKDRTSVVGKLHAEFANRLFAYRIDWTGDKADIQELGWTFEMPKQYDRFSWKREAPWSVYPDDHIGRPTGTATPDSVIASVTNITRPDAFDFNSTKYNCDWATLTNGENKGLRVEFASDQRHHVKAGIGKNDAYELIVNRQCSPPRDISSPCVPDLYLELKPGDHVEGKFYIESQ